MTDNAEELRQYLEITTEGRVSALEGIGIERDTAEVYSEDAIEVLHPTRRGGGR